MTLELSRISKSLTIAGRTGPGVVISPCTKMMFGGNATKDGILGQCHLLNDNTFADVGFEDVNFLEVEPKAPCAFPKALVANAVILAAL